MDGIEPYTYDELEDNPARQLWYDSRNMPTTATFSISVYPETRV